MAKNPTIWTKPAKSTESWVVVGRTPTTWLGFSGTPELYTYSDASVTYDSTTHTYNYFFPGSKNPTTWVNQ